MIPCIEFAFLKKKELQKGSVFSLICSPQLQDLTESVSAGLDHINMYVTAGSFWYCCSNMHNSAFALMKVHSPL